jgi:hypothetical protein
LLNAYLELNPEPLYLAGLNDHRAECRRRLGDADRERDFLTSAASAHIGTRWESMARERLASLATTAATTAA